MSFIADTFHLKSKSTKWDWLPPDVKISGWHNINPGLARAAARWVPGITGTNATIHWDSNFRLWVVAGYPMQVDTLKTMYPDAEYIGLVP